MNFEKKLFDGHECNLMEVFARYEKKYLIKQENHIMLITETKNYVKV